jgi:hypothetical protein
MYIDGSSGNVGVGVGAPGRLLDVNTTFRAGSVNISGFINTVGTVMTDASGTLYVASSSSSVLWGGNTSGDIWNLNSGNVGIGTTNPSGFKLKVAGNMAVTGTLSTQTGSDFAEEFTVAQPIAPGTVVAMGDLGYKSVQPCSRSYDKTVVGIVSDNPSIVAGRSNAPGANKVIVAMVGVVSVKVTALNGPISKGDLLTSSSLTGYAMKASADKQGTIIGKALEDLAGRRGEIKVLVNLQ